MSTLTQRKPQGDISNTKQQSVSRRSDGKKWQLGSMELFKDNPSGQSGQDLSKSETTGALRIDLNLEAQVTVKAKIHGDLTLALEM
ncbi:hypothetical protein VKS41_007262 [Umbelopsis sp. WA50703]|jgi:hypothetical protein